MLWVWIQLEVDRNILSFKHESEKLLIGNKWRPNWFFFILAIPRLVYIYYRIEAIDKWTDEFIFGGIRTVDLRFQKWPTVSQPHCPPIVFQSHDATLHLKDDVACSFFPSHSGNARASYQLLSMVPFKPLRTIGGDHHFIWILQLFNADDWNQTQAACAASNSSIHYTFAIRALLSIFKVVISKPNFFMVYRVRERKWHNLDLNLCYKIYNSWNFLLKFEMDIGPC